MMEGTLPLAKLTFLLGMTLQLAHLFVLPFSRVFLHTEQGQPISTTVVKLNLLIELFWKLGQFFTVLGLALKIIWKY